MATTGHNNTAELSRRTAMTPALISLLSLLTLSLLLATAPVRSQDDEASSIVCTEEGRVVLNADGELEYGSLSPTDPPVREEYSPQGLAGWYNLARGFVNVVQPENLPYDVIEATIEDNDLPCTVRGEDNCEGGDVDVEATLRDFSEWWAPLIAVTVLGGVMAIVFGLVGAIFWCCRCCGQCGGGRSKKDPQDKYMFVISVILLLVALLLFVGVVLSFYSNEQSFDTIDSLQDTVNEIIATGVDYMNAFLDDGDTLFCQFVQITDVALDETTRLNNSLNELINDTGVDVDTVLQQLDMLSTGINQTSDLLTNVSDTTMTIQSQSATLNTALDDVASDVEALRTQCDSIPTVSSQCSNIPDASTFQAGANYTNLPDVTQELNDVQESLDGIDISNSVEEGNAEFERVTGDIQSEINSNLGGLNDSSNSSGVLGSLTDANNTLFETRDEVVGNITRVIRNDFDFDDCPSLDDIFAGNAEDIDVDVGFIRECYINQIFERIKEYDVYRYAFGIIICSLALLTVVLTIVGIALGVLGWRRDRTPDSRTRASHCGGIILLINVGLTFLFGFVLLILASLAFFFGSNMQKICQAIEPPEYEVFTRIVDNTELWQGSLLGETLLQSRGNLSLSGALRACDRNEALYTAFNLSSLFDIRMDIVNTTETFGELEQQLNDTINSFNYTSDSFLDANTRSALNNFTAASVENINITAFTETLSANVLSFNLTEAISTLQDLSAAFTMAGQPGLAMNTSAIITQLQDIQNNQLPAIEMNVQLLESQVDDLSTHIDTVVVNTSDVVGEIDVLVRNITGDEFRENIQVIVMATLDNLEFYIQSFINHTATAIEVDVGRCRPLSVIYMNAYDLACNEAVDGLNGYWWSLGFCAVCFIPLIILAVLASTHYLKQRRENDEDAYPDFPLKAR